MKETIALVPGTFDPVHLGHEDIIAQASESFDKVIWAVGQNAAKKCSMYALLNRTFMMHRVANKYPNVRVERFSGMIWDFIAVTGATHVVRSMRMNMDHQTELDYTLNVRKFSPGTIFTYFLPKQEHFHISSSTVRELIRGGSNLGEYLAPEIEAYLKQIVAID